MDRLHDGQGSGGAAAHGRQTPDKETRGIRDRLPIRCPSNHALNRAWVTETDIVTDVDTTG